MQMVGVFQKLPPPPQSFGVLALNHLASSMVMAASARAM